jgi:hypothetical protein
LVSRWAGVTRAREREVKKTYLGGCHCGAVRFAVDVDVGAGTTKCNCTICAKSRLWTVQATPETFRLISGEETLQDYSFSAHVAHSFFCRICGVRPYQYVEVPDGPTYYNVNLACLDDVDIDELVGAPVTYVDQLNDRWWESPAEVRHL